MPKQKGGRRKQRGGGGVRKQTGGGRRRRRAKLTQMGGAVRGTFGPSYPDYAEINHPFHAKFTQPPPHIARGGYDGITRTQLHKARTMNKLPQTSDTVTLIIKGRPVKLYPKGRRIAETTQ